MIPTQISAGGEKPKIREFKIGERVKAREYLKHDKWRFGTVLERIGRLHYVIELDDGKIWRRHIDQLQCTGENSGIIIPRNEIQPDVPIHDAKEPHEVIVIAPPNPIPTPSNSDIISTNESPDKCDVPNEPIAVDRLIGPVVPLSAKSPVPTPQAEKPATTTTRTRSGRTIKPPKRLDL